MLSKEEETILKKLKSQSQEMPVAKQPLNSKKTYFPVGL